MDIYSKALQYQPIPQMSAIKAGRYEVRFANTTEEIMAAQRLRFQVLYQENQGRPSQAMLEQQSEIDEWDDPALHIVVLDTRSEQESTVVGTLRLTLNDRLNPGQKFYTEKAFDLSKLRERYHRIMELSRFCIDSKCRSGGILILIWKFAMKFIVAHQVNAMFGCASFHGTDISEHAPILSYLYKYNLAPSELRPTAAHEPYIHIPDILTPENDWESAKKSVPTLLRGYLKLGAKISDSAIVDPVFNTIFTCIYVDTEDMIKTNPTLFTN